MKSVLVASLVAGLFSAGTSETAAAANFSVQVPANRGLLLVEGGCGDGRFRDRYGYCHQRFYASPGAYYRRCPPGLHMTLYGCRLNY